MPWTERKRCINSFSRLVGLCLAGAGGCGDEALESLGRGRRGARPGAG